MKISEYLKDKDGKPSSTRLFSHRLMVFFILINVLVLLGYIITGILAVIKSYQGSPMEFKFWIDVSYILGLDLLTLLGIFAPKSFNKVQEVRQIIESSKGSKS